MDSKILHSVQHENEKTELSITEIRGVALAIMQDIHTFCQQHHIRYVMVGGTLLGAVRHKGFIPWDDDIDIAMPREDYERFLHEFNGAYSHLVVLSADQTENFYLPWAKVMDTSTVLYENVTAPIEMGINIDVFPIDYCSDDIEKAKILNRYVGIFRNALSAKNIKTNMKRVWYKAVELRILHILLSHMNRNQLAKKINKLAQKYSLQRDSKYLAMMVAMTYGEKEIIEAEQVFPCCMLEFEGRTFSAPRDYNAFLSHLYGDYMKLPPIEKQVTQHSFVAYNRTSV